MSGSAGSEQPPTGRAERPSPDAAGAQGSGAMQAPESRAGASPGSDEEYNPGPPTRPRQAATVILLRGGDTHLEVLLVKRTPKARFMGGVWVLPGGAVDDSDRASPGGEHEAELDAGTLRAAAVRELREEAGIELSEGDELIALSRWITPARVRIRFDTHFFLAALPSGQQPRVDGSECVDHRWFTPHAALEASRAQEIALVFPTVRHLEQLSRFPSADALLADTRGREVAPVEPQMVLEGEVARVLLPGDPGYLP